MYLRYGLLADAVVPGAMGKKNIIGTFLAIYTPQFPCIHPSLSLAIRVEGAASEIGQYDFELGFVDADYKEVIPPLKSQLNLEKETTILIEGIPVASEATINVENIPLPQAGSYEFVVKVDGRHLGSIPLYAVKTVP